MRLSFKIQRTFPVAKASVNSIYRGPENNKVRITGWIYNTGLVKIKEMN
jgi:hypothetical protein